jgi:hypothetical protein
MKDKFFNLPIIILQDILEVKSGIIVQQVNCQYQMGAGLAKAITNKWSVVRDEYLAKTNWQLGDVQFVQVAPYLFVANVAGQQDCGTKERQTNFAALSLGLSQVNICAKKSGLSIYLPYGLGSGLAGGKTKWEKRHTWMMVQKIMEEVIDLPIIALKPNSEVMISGKTIQMKGRGSGRRCHITRNYQPSDVYGVKERELAIAQSELGEMVVRVGKEYEITPTLLQDLDYQKAWAEMERTNIKKLLALETANLWGLPIEPLGNYRNGRIVLSNEY